MSTLAEAMAFALRCHESGDLAGAETVYQQILSADPLHPDALHNLGVIAYQRGMNDVAADWMQRSVAVLPGNEMFHCNLGLTYHALRRFDEAVSRYLEALRIKPEFAEAFNNLGNALIEQGKLEQAIGCFQRALGLRPDYVHAHNNLGNAFAAQGRLDESVTSCRRAIALRPQYAPAHASLGATLQRLGKLEEAVTHCREAIRLAPDSANAHNNLAAALSLQGQDHEAAEHCRQALQVNPHQIDAHCNLASILLGWGRVDEAEEHLRTALALQPRFVGAHMTLGLVRQLQGRLAEATASYREAVRLDPNDRTAHSNLLMCLNYDPRIGTETLLAEHRAWGARFDHVKNFGPSPEHDRDPTRRLRIGYVSPNFGWHSVSYFLEPILANHDPDQVEAICYSQVTAPDDMTRKLMRLAKEWRSTHGLSDEQMAELIRTNRIDILVDLAGHTASSRLAVFAQKSAPVQASYLGYPCTTGLSAVDYFVTDAVADPVGEENGFTEELYRLPAGFCCYAPPALAPDVGPLPAVISGFVTFGSMHPLAKLNDEVLELWSLVLRAVPKSRLLIFRDTIQGSVRENLLQRLANKGIDHGRVDLRHEIDERYQHFGTYQAIDISLDAFPWSGHTTACESLWMGVPVVTLRGARHAGRMAASVLTQVGLPELIADTREEYVEIAKRLASDVESLQQLGLREKMRESPLCDGKVFTEQLEAGYREMWQRWCRTGSL